MHGLIGDLEAGLIAGKFRHCRLIGGRQPTFGIGCGAVKQKLRRFELERHVGKLPLQSLELAERPAELLANGGVFPREIEGVAPECQRPRRITDALDVKSSDLLLEPTLPEQQVCLSESGNSQNTTGTIAPRP